MNLEKTIFISDMDETLFDNEKHISDRNLKAIMEYQKKGGFFTVANTFPSVVSTLASALAHLEE